MLYLSWYVMNKKKMNIPFTSNRFAFIYAERHENEKNINFQQQRRSR